MILISYLFFLICITLFFTLPGLFLIKKTKLNLIFLEKVVLATAFGFVGFTSLSYILIILKLDLVAFIISLVLGFLWLKSLKKAKPSIKFPLKKTIILTTLLTLGVIGQLAIISPSGRFQSNDLIFYSAHGHDGAWHIALMEEIKKGWPFQNPVYAGEKLVNYHFFSDIAPSQFSKFSLFSNLDLYFRFFPLLYSFLLGSIAYLLGRKLGGFFWAGIWALIFTQFAGSFGFIVTWLQNQRIAGESIFWASQIQSSSGNPPQIISNFLVLSILYIFFIMQKQKNGWLFVIACLIISSLIGFKAYAAIVVLTSLGVVGIWQVIKERRFWYISLFLIASFFSALIYLPNSVGSSAFLIFEPWWYIRTMIVSESRLNWLDLEHKRQTYLADGNFKRVIQVELTGFLIFLFGNLGLRFLGFWGLLKLIKTSLANYFNLLFILITVISFILPLLFLQKGVASNSIQFLQYFLLLFGIVAGLSVSQLIRNLKWPTLKLILSCLIILLAVPTQLGLIYDFYRSPPLAKISSAELSALGFLNKNTPVKSLILTPPYNPYLDLKQTTPNIWDWFDSGYVSAFSSRRTYLSDYEQVDIMGYDLQSRLGLQKDVFEEEDPLQFNNKVKQTKANYLYFPKAQAPKVDITKVGYSKIFSNEQIEIWQIN